MTEGIKLFQVSKHWMRESPAFPRNRIEVATTPEPEGAFYHLTGEVLDRILRDAGWLPVTETHFLDILESGPTL